MRQEYAGVGLHWASASDVGRVRTLNEDSLVAKPPVFAIADGMGGHEAGEIASALTIQRLTDLASSDPPDIDSVALEFQSIHETLRNASVGGRPVDMGTTAVSLMMVRQGGVLSWLVVNIGDSRMYSVSDNSMGQVTNDHSYVQELVDAGEIEPAAMRDHPQKNIVTQALGAIEVAKPDFWVRPISRGERFLLCSDGLTGELDDEEIASVLMAGIPPEDVVTILKDRALERGGRDNVSIVVVDVESVPTAIDESTDTNPGTNRRFNRSALSLKPPMVPAEVRPLEGPDLIGLVPPVSDGGGVPDSTSESSGASGSDALIDLVPGADDIPEPEVVRPSTGVSVIERLPDSIVHESHGGHE